MNSSIAEHSSAQWHTSYVALAFASALLLVLGLSTLLQSSADFYWLADDLLVQTGDDPRWSNPGLTESDWLTMKAGGIDSNLASVFWARTDVVFPSAPNWPSPLSIQISGLFSAEIFWDGQLLASKGVPAVLAAEEIPGPLDTSFYLPEHLRAPGTHSLALRISSHNVGYQADQLIHLIGITPYKPEQRRSLLYYAIPGLLIGSLLIMSLQFLRMWWSSAELNYAALAFIALCGLLQALTEISRSMIEIPYDWQLLRGGLVLLFALGTGVGLNLLLLISRQDKIAGAFSLVGLMVALIRMATIDGLDGKTTFALVSLAIAPAYFGISDLLAKRNSPLAIMPLLTIAWLLLAYGESTLFLDNLLFGSLVSFLLFSWVLQQAYVPRSSAPQSNITPSSSLIAESLGKKIKVPLQEIFYVQADGNYTQLVGEDGKVQLSGQRLGEILTIQPALIRVHRSYAVNPAFVHSLNSKEGSRYSLELVNGEQLPVSRYRVKEIRSALGF